MSASLNRIPCTIITGFLGSGKTTLLRHVIENLPGKRLAVIVNEFGDIGIDGEVLKSCGVENCPENNIVELANGCICCTVADDFVPALDKLLEQKPPVDHILIETSGLALPKPLVQAFQWPSVKSKVTVDAVIAVVDGDALANGRVAHDHHALDEQRKQDASLDHDDPIEEVFEDQVACADLVVVAKADLLDDAMREHVMEDLAHMLPPSVKTVFSHNGKVQPSVLLGLGMAVEDDIDNRHSHHDHEEEHDHDDFATFHVDIPVISDVSHLLDQIRLVTEDDHVLRIKGFIDVKDKPMRLQIQTVGPRINHYFDRAWKPAEKRVSRLVVIGEKGIDQAAITQKLQS